VLDQLPDVSDDLATLWSMLQLSPEQVDALAVIHKYAHRSKTGIGKKGHEFLKTEIKALLSADQASLVEKFLSTHACEDGSGFQENMGRREVCFYMMHLSGEQKIELVTVILDHRKAIIDAAGNVVEAKFTLHDAIHADAPDQGVISEAAVKFGNAVGNAAHTSVALATAAKEVLTPSQLDQLDDHMTRHLDRRLAKFQDLPAKLHDAVDCLQALDLTPEQKEQIIIIMADYHGMRHCGHFRLGKML
jgi:Spy/CpxP family protein refolding chaperone